MLKIAALASRAFQILFSGVVLGLSLTLAREQVYGKWPTSYTYGVFLGAFGIIVGFFGLIRVFIHTFDHTVITVALDGVATLLFVAGGAALAIQLKGGCSALNTMLQNKLINCGAYQDKQQNWYGLCLVDQSGTLDQQWLREYDFMSKRCSEAKADYGLMFATAGMSILAMAAMIAWKRSGSGKYAF